MLGGSAEVEGEGERLGVRFSLSGHCPPGDQGQASLPRRCLSNGAVRRGKEQEGGFCTRSPGGSRFPSFQLKELIASTRLGTYYNSSSVYSFG